VTVNRESNRQPVLTARSFLLAPLFSSSVFLVVPRHNVCPRCAVLYRVISILFLCPRNFYCYCTV